MVGRINPLFAWGRVYSRVLPDVLLADGGAGVVTVVVPVVEGMLLPQAQQSSNTPIL